MTINVEKKLLRQTMNTKNIGVAANCTTSQSELKAFPAREAHVSITNRVMLFDLSPTNPDGSAFTLSPSAWMQPINHRGKKLTRNLLHLKDMYVDLLVRIITNSIYRDNSIHPHLDRDYKESVREQGGDWPAVAHTMVGAMRMRNLADLTCRVLDDGIPGDFIETGVWRGGCCILMRALLDVYIDHQRRVFVCDSFEGLPKPKEEYELDAGDPHHTYEALAVSLEQVQENFSRYSLLDEQCVFVKGLFADTLKTLRGNRFALLRLDGDMYESTICALNELYPMLSQGGYIIIDDYGAIEGCRQAVQDYRHEHKITESIHEVDWTGIWWQKRY